MSEQIQNEFMTTAEAAKMLGIHPSTAGQYCQRGDLAAIKIGVSWAIKRASVERYIAARRQHKPAPRPHKRVSKRPVPVGTEQVQWTAPEPWDWGANVRATWDDKVQAAIRQLRGPGQ